MYRLILALSSILIIFVAIGSQAQFSYSHKEQKKNVGQKHSSIQCLIRAAEKMSGFLKIVENATSHESHSSGSENMDLMINNSSKPCGSEEQNDYVLLKNYIYFLRETKNRTTDLTAALKQAIDGSYDKLDSLNKELEDAEREPIRIQLAQLRQELIDERERWAVTYNYSKLQSEQLAIVLELYKTKQELKDKTEKWTETEKSLKLESERIKKELTHEKENCAIEKSKIEASCAYYKTLFDDKCHLQNEAVIFKSAKNGYVHTPYIGLHKVFTDGKNWTEANQTCHDEGGHLTVINSRAEEQLIIRMAQEAQGILHDKGVEYWAVVWIGIHSLHEKNKWVTVTGEPLNSTDYNGHWGMENNDRQPNYAKARCGSVISYVSRSHEPGLADDACSFKLGYICELPVIEC